MKTLTSLLTHRTALNKQARLANLAYAYQTLGRFEERITRARLQGSVNLKHAAPEEERYWASLTALDHSQSVIEEHFSDTDLMDLADVVSFVTGNDTPDVTFPLEELAERFLHPLRSELEHEGIAIDLTTGCPDMLPGRGDAA